MRCRCVSQMLRVSARVVADPRVATALDNPMLDAAAKESLLLSVCGDALNPEGRSFMRVLIEGDRITVLPAIQVLFEALKDSAEGVAKALIETAYPLEGAGPGRARGRARARFGKKIEASVVVKPDVIGGARITVGDNVIDGTVQEQLRAMATQLRA